MNMLKRGAKWNKPWDNGKSNTEKVLPADSKIERQELYCHDCGNYVQFNIDMSLNGNHVLRCPKCGHEHCRVVKNGKIMDDRWDQRNGAPTYWIISSSYTSTSTVSVTNYMYNSWTNAATTEWA